MNVDPLRAGDPDRLGGYWLAGRLGSGGQGVVYEAYDEAANRVAVKVLHAYLAGDPQLRRRFTREVAAAQRVASFCTAPVLGHDLDGERPYIVSQFVPGPSMRAAVTAPLTGDALHRLAVGMATALAAIHQAGVVHRDLKPENVLLGPDGPRVIDFGIARAAGLSMTSTGELTGTPLYMAPELFSGGRAEPAADVFAWGAMVCFTATGRDAFGAPTTVATIHRLLTEHPDLSMLPSPLRELVDRALSKDPSLRPTAQDLLLALLGGTASLAAGARAASAVRPPEELAGEPALGHIAELVYGSLPPDGREVARQLMLRLVDVREGDELPRPVALDELPDPAAAEPVLAALAGAALIERGAETISVRKGALLRAWPRLHEWVDGDRDSLSRHRRLGEAARRWARNGRHPEDLLRGTALYEASAWAADLPSHFTLNVTEKTFLEASRAQSVRQGRRRRLVVTSLAGLLVVSLTAGAFAWRQSMLSDESGRQLAAERAQAGARRVALQAEALRKSDPTLAMRLSLAAYQIADVPESRAAVFNSAGQQEQRVFTDPVLTNAGRALSVDGSTLISAGADKVTAYDVASGKVLRSFTGVGAGPFAAAISPDGDTLALYDENGKIALWSMKSGKKLGEGKQQSVVSSSIRFSPSGRYVMVSGNGGGPFDGLWDVAARRSIGYTAGNFNVIGPGDRFGMVSIGKDYVSLSMRSLPSGTPLAAKLPKKHAVVGFTPDGKWAALNTGSKMIMWNLAAGTGDDREFPEDYPRVVFSSDGSLGVVSSGNRVTVYRMSDAARIARFTSAAWPDGEPRLSKDNRYLTLLDQAGQVTVYDLGEQPPPSLHLEEDDAKEISADGRTVYTFVSGAEQAWTLPGLKRVGPLFEIPADVGGTVSTEISPDGKILASTDTAYTDGPLTLWNLATRRKLATISLSGRKSGDNKSGPVFSPDGRLVALSYNVSNDYYNMGSVTVVEVAAPHRKRFFDTVSGGQLNFSADSRTLTTGDGGGVDVIDLVTGKVLPRSQGPGTTAKNWLVLDPTGTRAASPYGERGVVLWDTRTWKPASAVFRVGGYVGGAWFSPDGRTIAVTHDYRVTLFDVASGRQLGSPRALATQTQDTYSASRTVISFAADSRSLRAIASDGTLRELSLDPAKVAGQVCSRAGRGLNAGEWREHVGQDFAFTPTC
ncbi:WD40 repeat domain-containing serine/threonine protein kinase [Nonomuraea sp. NPDC050556]|uniref:WD40 repeat domain-containing serine/threonine protein kinase n=1 Tax=Nonomuraea sp. NPDC050556 TaxID=3364369 RepID=UPI0037A680A2